MRRSLLVLLASLLCSAIIVHADDTRPNTDTALYPMCHAFVRSTPDKVFPVVRGIEPPRVLVRIDPEYSELAKNMRLEGKTLLTLVVNREGFPVGICIQHGLFPDLDQKAARAVAQWRFSPATKNGEPVSVLVNVDVAFRLY